MNGQQPMDPDMVKAIAAQIRKLSEFNSTSVRDLALHFQILLSAKESRVLMEAPGLYFRDLPLLVISKSGISRGHATLYQAIAPLIPEDKRQCFAFVLYPGSFIRSCLDKVLCKTAKVITRELRLSMENVFNRKYHPDSLVYSEVEQEIINFIRRDLMMIAASRKKAMRVGPTDFNNIKQGGKTMRWYDQYETLGRHIDSLKGMNASHRDHLIRGIQEIMQKHSPSLLDESVMDFPLDMARQRWYDKDPYLWLTINGLQQADPDLLETVALYLEEMSQKIKEPEAAEVAVSVA